MFESPESNRLGRHRRTKKKWGVGATAVASLLVASVVPFDLPSQASNVDYVLNFDGQGDIAKSTTFTPPSNNVYTVETWWQAPTTFPTKTGDYTDQRAILTVGGTSQLYIFASTNHSLTVYMANNLLGSYSFTARKSSWNHIALVRNGASLTLYFNGTSVLTNSNLTSNILNSGFRIGAFNDDGRWGNGEFDQVKFWDVALTPEQIAASSSTYNVSEGTPGSGDLLLHYDFDEGTGGTVTNRAVGGGNNLSILGNPQFQATDRVVNVTSSGCTTTVGAAAGVVATSNDGWCYVGFTNTGGNSLTVPNGVSSLQLLVIGGGGAGGAGAWGGGGGAGELLIHSGYAVSSGDVIPINVGAGGASGAASLDTTLNRSNNGANSWVGSSSAPGVVAIGGGAGASYAYNSADSLTKGNNGGSGGGGTEHTNANNTGGLSLASSAGSRTGYGFAGGNGAPSGGTQGSGGGGGSGAAGANGGNGIGGAGGQGTNAASTWLAAISSAMGAGWQSATSAGRIAAGGGGGTRSSGTAGVGGTGGGGAGSNTTGTTNGTAGVANTGSGGGGAAFSPAGLGGAGGSGLIVIRYSVSYTITLNKGTSGTGSNQTLTKTQGQTLSLPNSATANSYFTRTGYTVTGWTTSDGGAQTHSLNGSFTTDANTTLYPVWTGNTYTITYDSNGGSSASNGTFTVGGSGLTLPTVTRTGYTFAGWFEASDFSGSALSGTYSPTQTRTVYAKWTANTYNVTYDEKGGSNVSNGTFITGGTISFPTSPTKSGYTFAGWSETDGGTAVSIPYSPGVTTNITMYALWTSTLAITTPTSGLTGTRSEPYSLSISTSGGSGTNTFSVTGTLPSGLSINSSTGVISGTPTSTGSSSVTVTVTDSSGATKTTNSFTITISNPSCSPTTDTSSSPGFTILKFKTLGSCDWVVPSGASSAEVLVVAGGGGGAFGNNAGGGGAGEVLVTGSATLSSGTVSNTSTISLTPGDTVTITVGAGGSSGAPNTSTETNASSAWSCCSGSSTPGGTGGNSAFGSVVAKGGGGGGGGGTVFRLNGENGGSGGGGASNGSGGQAQSLATYSGWTSFKNNGSNGSNGSGGGAGGAGSTRGGAGVTVLGMSVAGGGGGWGRLGGANSLSDTVLGGNGRLASGTWGYAGTAPNYTSPGTPNTGTGGGAGAPGGSGLVVVRYQTAFIITYNYNSATGGNATSSDSFQIGGNAITLPIPSRTNFTFEGWYEASDFSGSSVGSTYTPTQSRTLYAKWASTQSTVTFNANDGSGSPSTSTQSVNNGVATALTSNSFTRTGYTFAGWNTLADGTGTNYTNQQSVTLSGNLTLYAKWTANTYTVTYTYNSADGGTRPTTDSFTVGGSAISLPTPTRTGYTFAGWYGEVGLATLVGNAGASYSPTGDVTLYAKWNANNNTVTFKSNYVGGADDTTQTIVTGASTALTSNSFTRTGYTFAGWNTLANGTGTNYTNGQSVTINSALTLYAKWTVGTYTITYNYNSATGGNAAASGTFTTGGSNLVLPVPTKTGYTFGGWYDDSGFTGSALASSISTTTSKTIYAKWDAATFTVLYEYNSATGGNTTSSNSYTTGSTAITLPTPTRTGYTFAGWYESSALTGSAVNNTYTTTQNRTLYAKWTAVNYTVTYNADIVVSGNTISPNSGSAPTNNNTYNIGQSFSVAANTGGLARTGYTFAGWVTNQDGTGTAKNSGETITFAAANVNLYPKWTPNTYTISYNLNGGSGSLSGAPTSWTVGDSNVTLPSSGFSKTGYDFAGWAKTQGGSVVNNSFNNFGDVTLYAVWTIKSINYSFDKGTAVGQTIASWPSNASSNFGTTITLPNLSGTTVTINGGSYLFFGWTSGGTTYQSGSSFTLGETAPTFTAEWVQVFDVRYGYAGGTHAVAGDTDDECTTGGLCVNNQSITLRTAPTRTGYVFDGWRVQDTGTNKAAGATHTILATEYLFYARWTAIDYDFSFNSMGGSNSHASVTSNIGQVVTMPNPGTKTGYTFAGWSPDGGSTKYSVGTTFLVGSESKAFIAYWTPNVYTVVFDWQGASGTPTPNASYTVGTGSLTLPVIGDRTKDGYTFGGWSESPGGTAVSNFVPTANDVLYAIWNDGNYTLSYDGRGASAGSGSGSVGRGQSVTLPTPVRNGFVFNGWYDAETGGNKIGNGGQSHTPDRSKTMYARWVQKSLWGVDPATLESANEYTASDNTGVDTTLTHNPTGTSARVKVPAGALPNGTKVNVQYFKDTDRQSALIPGDNSYFFSVLVSWLSGTGTSATVPNTSAGKPIEVTLTNNSIKAGAMAYMVIGEEVRELGRATQDGTITVELTEDPEIVVAATAPGSPASVVAVAGDQQATISWAAPNTNGGSQISSYTVTASPGGATCTTSSTSCTITGLTNGTAYTFAVVATNAVGSSSAANSSSITPALATFTVTYNSNGGSAVTSGSFQSGGSVSAPSSPTRSGYTFDGWSTTLNDASTKVTFPYSPGVTNNITLYALWAQVQNNGGGGSGGSGGGSTPVVTPTPTPTPGPTPGPTAPPSQIGFNPTPPSTPVVETGPIGSVVGNSEPVKVVKDAPSEKIIATAGSWQLEIKPPVTEETTKPVTEKLELQFPVAAKAEIKGTGLQPNTTVEAWVFSEPTYIGTIKVGSDGSFASSLNLPKNLLPGQHTLQIGSLNAQGQLVTLSIPITIKGSVSVGTFRGFVAIFTKDLAGQELSAKVAGKWIKQSPIKNFKRFNYSRLVRFTGAGYDIVIDVYINKKFYKRYTTRTR